MRAETKERPDADVGLGWLIYILQATAGGVEEGGMRRGGWKKKVFSVCERLSADLTA